MYIYVYNTYTHTYIHTYLHHKRWSVSGLTGVAQNREQPPPVARAGPHLLFQRLHHQHHGAMLLGMGWVGWWVGGWVGGWGGGGGKG